MVKAAVSRWHIGTMTSETTFLKISGAVIIIILSTYIAPLVCQH